MEEARKIKGITNYPFFHIPSTFLSEGLDAKKDKDVISLGVGTTVNFNETVVLLNSKMELHPNGAWDPVETREDESIVLVLFTISDTNIQYGSNSQPIMKVSFITNYGNMGSVEPGKSMADKRCFNISVHSSGNRVGVSWRWSSVYGDGRGDYGHTSNTLRKIELPPKECYVPQFVVDVISTFLNFTKSGNPSLIPKFKKLCYDFTHGLIGDTKKKEECDRRLAQYEQAIDDLESENEKLRRKISQYEKAFDKLESENESLSEKVSELTEEVFGIKTFYNLPLSFKFKR